MIDASASDHPQVYAYYPDLDRCKVSDEMWQARYNHILRSPLRTVWQDARPTKMDVPTYNQVKIAGGFKEQRLLSKDVLEVNKTWV